MYLVCVEISKTLDVLLRKRKRFRPFKFHIALLYVCQKLKATDYQPADLIALTGQNPSAHDVGALSAHIKRCMDRRSIERSNNRKSKGNRRDLLSSRSSNSRKMGIHHWRPAVRCQTMNRLSLRLKKQRMIICHNLIPRKIGGGGRFGVTHPDAYMDVQINHWPSKAYAC